MYYYGHSSWEDHPNDARVDELFDAKNVAIADHREGSNGVSPQSNLSLAPTYSNHSHHSHHSHHSIDPADHQHQQNMYSGDQVELGGMGLEDGLGVNGGMNMNSLNGGMDRNLGNELGDHHLSDHHLSDHHHLDDHLTSHLNGDLDDQLDSHLNGDLNGDLNGNLNGDLNGQLDDHLSDHLNDHLNDSLHGNSLHESSANTSINSSSASANMNTSARNITSSLGINDSFSSRDHQNHEFNSSINEQYFSPALSFQGTPLMSPQAMAPQNPHAMGYNRYRGTPNLGKITKPSPSVRWRSSSVPELDELGDFDLGDSAISFLDSQSQPTLPHSRAVGQQQVASKVPVSNSSSNAGQKEFDIDDKLQAALNATTNATTTSSSAASRRASIDAPHPRRASNASSQRGGSRNSTPRIRPKISLPSISSSSNGTGGSGGSGGAGGTQAKTVNPPPYIDIHAANSTNSSGSSGPLSDTLSGPPSGPGSLDTPNGVLNGGSPGRNGPGVLSASTSPAIQPHVGGHFQGSPQFNPQNGSNEDIYDTFKKSNYQNLVDGTHQFLGLAGAERMATSLKSKKTVHKIAEKERRNRMSSAILELSSLMGPVDDPTSITTSKAATVERAIVYIKKLHKRLEELEPKPKDESK